MARGRSARRVAVTGVGLITPIGTGLDAVWSACCEGVSGVAEVSSYDASTFPVRIGGEVKDFSPRQHIDRKLDHDVATVNHQERGCGNNQEPVLKRKTDDGV